MSSPPDYVGFIGLGTMGGPMARNLARAGVPLVVHDAVPAVSRAVGTVPGVTVATSPSEVAANVAVLFTALPNNDIVRQVYLGPGGIVAGGRSGLITCDCSTVSPDVTVELHAAPRRACITSTRRCSARSPRRSPARSSSSSAATDRRST